MDLVELVHHVVPRQDQGTGNTFLDTIGNASKQKVNLHHTDLETIVHLECRRTNHTLSQIDGKAALFSFGVSASVGIFFVIVFCFVRPHNNVVYAPRAKYADSKHAPPPVTRGLFGWLKPLITTKETELIEKIGLDATIFLRCARMLRNIFAVLSVIGCGILIPVNIVAYNKSPVEQPPPNTDRIDTGFKMMTPVFLYKDFELAWAYVVVAWLFDIVICFFLWINYRVVARFRQQYFESSEYRNSLHARTLMITDIPKELRTDEGITRIVEGAGGSRETPRAAVARNVKDLPELVEEYEDLVKSLEKVLARYLKNPDKLPATRPLCKPSSKDKSYTKGQKVDAIEYLTNRIKHLEMEIEQVRESVDKRNALPFGFASFQDIAEAHAVAYATQKKAPQGTTISLATKPNDLIWSNLPLLKQDRRWRTIVNAMWITLLTVVFIIPNILIVIFLANLSNLAAVWPAFQKTYSYNDKFWSAVQGILAPAITFLIYLYLPSIFRRIRVKAGDVTKTSRERHVTGAL
jgi:hypothetical protein